MNRASELSLARFALLAPVSLISLMLVLVAGACSGSSGGGGNGTGDGGDGSMFADGASADGAVDGTSGGGDDGGPGAGEGGTTDGAPDVDGSPAPDLWNFSNQTVSVGGTMRSYWISVPKNYDMNKSYPLVLSFHGDGENGNVLRSFFEFENASGTDAIVIYPDGIGGTWDLYDFDPQNKDFAFMDSLLAKVSSDYNIDKTRVFGIGWSNGGFFVNTLACFRPTMLAAFASNSGGQPNTMDGNFTTKFPNGYYKCTTGEGPVAAFIVHGAIDGTVDVSSGQSDSIYWGYVNGCSDNTSATTPAPCQVHDNCPAGQSVVYCEIPTMGHSIWSETVTSAWAFFKAQRP